MPAPAGDGGAVKLAGQIAIWLTQHVQCVEVPPRWYDDIRTAVYERDSQAARRLRKADRDSRAILREFVSGKWRLCAIRRA